MNAVELERPFSLERVALLMRCRFFEEAPAVGIGAAIILGLNLLGLVIAKSAIFNHMGTWHGGGAAVDGSPWGGVLFLGGVVLASAAFKAFHEARGTDYILLPATSEEKYASAFLEVVVAFPLAGAAVASLMSALLALIEGALGGTGGSVWLPWGLEILKDWGRYAAVATVFLAGSATFGKTAWLKTIGVALAYFAVMCTAAVVVIWAFSPEGWERGRTVSSLGWSFSLGGRALSERATRTVQAVADMLSFGVVPAFALFFGAAKVAEKEGRDAVQ